MKRAVVSSTVGRLVEVSQVVVPGVYAWAITVVPVATERTTSGWAYASAGAALVCLVGGAVVAKSRPRIGYLLGIWGFIIGCIATWLIGMPALQISRLDPWRAGAGSIGWILFALGWGTPWRIGHAPEDDPRAQLHPKLEPRKEPRFRTVLSVAVGTVGALGCMLLAWRASESDRGMLLHGAAFACAVGIINTASAIGLAQGTKKTSVSSKQRIAYAFPWLMAVSALVVIAVAWSLGR